MENAKSKNLNEYALNQHRRFAVEKKTSKITLKMTRKIRKKTCAKFDFKNYSIAQKTKNAKNENSNEYALN